MLRFTYDISKNKMEIKTDVDDVRKNTKDIIVTVTICSTVLIGAWMLLEYKKFIT